MTFDEFHQTYPWIYNDLCKLARQVKARGRDRVSIRLLLEVVRWTHYVGERIHIDAFQFKIDNNHAPYYSRLIMAQEPDLEGLFELNRLRRVKNDRQLELV